MPSAVNAIGGGRGHCTVFKGRRHTSSSRPHRLSLLFAFAAISAIIGVATAAPAANVRRCARSFGDSTVQITGTWLEFCPCGGGNATKQIDPIDGNDNGCVSVQVARVTTTDDRDKVYGDYPPTPMRSTVSEADMDANRDIVFSSVNAGANKGAFLPVQRSGQNFYAVPADPAAFPSGVPVDLYEVEYGAMATLTAVIVTGGNTTRTTPPPSSQNNGNSSSLDSTWPSIPAGTLVLNTAQTRQPLRVGDRFLYVRCRDDDTGSQATFHNVYLRVKVFGAPSSALYSYADFLTKDFLSYVMTTDTMTPPQQVPFDDYLYAPQYGRLMEPAEVFGSRWLKVSHRGIPAHPIQNSAMVSPTFVFGVRLLPANWTGPVPTPEPTNATTATATTTTEQTTTDLDENATTDPNATTDLNASTTVTFSTTAYTGGAGGRRTTTPIPASAPPRGVGGAAIAIALFAALYAAAALL